MDKQDTLLPCPFCGASDKSYLFKVSSADTVCFVECSRCGCQGPSGIDKDQAAIFWNTRNG